MKEITFKSNMGRFAYTITAEVGEDVDAKSTNLCIRGLADTGFRAVASDVEKALVKAGGTDVNGAPVSKDSKRSEIGYTPERATLVQTTAQAKLDEVSKKDLLPAMVFEVTGEHEYGETGASPMVRATTFVNTLIAAGQEVSLRSTLSMFDATAATVDVNGLIAIANGAGLGIQPPKAKKTA